MTGNSEVGVGALRSGGRVVLRYGSLTVGVSSDDSSHLDWLQEFVTPSFGWSSTGGAAAVEVVLRWDRDAYSETDETKAGSKEIDVFGNDTEVVRLPSWNAPPHLVALDAAHQVHYRVSLDRSAIEILAAENSRRLRVVLMKAVRELAMNSIRSPSDLLLHAAAFEYEGRGVLIGGPKFAGKTSLLMFALGALPSSYVTNDRSWISLALEPHVHGMPTIVAIRDSSLELFPHLSASIRSGRFHHGRSLGEALAEPAPAPAPSMEKFGMTPAQFSFLLETDRTAGCPIGAILFPRWDEAPGALELTRLSAEQGLRRLGECFFGAGTRPSADRLFSLPGGVAGSGPDARDEVCRQLAARVRLFDCRVGPWSYSDPRSAEALRQGLAAV